MALLIVVTATASALLDNVTTVLLVAPVVLHVCRELGLPSAPYLISVACASNIGGTATLIGDPPNIMIASRSGLTFNDFLIHLAPVVVVLVLAYIGLCRIYFRHILRRPCLPIGDLDPAAEITDQRLLLIYGFIIRKVDMLPLSKVTDMTFRRSIVGRLLGYGTFVLESAGQDQALSDVHFIPDPNDTYLRIVATIFKTGGEDDGVPDDPRTAPSGPPPEDEGGARERRRGWFRRRRHERDPWDEEWDEEQWGEDDPTSRPVLRGEIVRHGHADPSGPWGGGGRDVETLYSSRPTPTDRWDGEDLDARRRRR